MNNLMNNLHTFGISVYLDKKKYPSGWIDLENTLIDALYECDQDRKMYGLLCSWTQVYGDKIIAEKLIKLYKRTSKTRGESVWFQMFLIFLTSNGDRRFKKSLKKYPKKTYPRDYFKEDIKFKGVDPTYKEYNIIVPLNTFRISRKNIIPPEILIKKNNILRNRYLIGANWRADIISAIESGINNPYRISKTIGCSYDPAYRVFQEYMIASFSIEGEKV